MKLDNEDDRNLLLRIIEGATIPGGAVMVVADLVSRIRAATVEEKQPHAPFTQTMNGSGDNVLNL